jgi:NADH-quinone oxidoreductase subunit G
MTEALVNIEVDGRPLQGRKGAMIIEVADEAGIYIPRFCYHKKLSIAANCRMCMVEVEKAPKPLPACATPITEGMKVFTQSPVAIGAQKGTMEFLLINHPLDCPICDQGGECELQDLAMGYGDDVSRYNEGKRVVKDKDIGPLIATDMTRCIHCTRCVRFGEEIAGLRELGATGRGEFTQIGTYIEHTVTSEMSGNVIDLCPVGALTSKPFRYTARSWELVQHAGIAPHDAIGSNLYLHTRRGQVMRVVPRENEAINEVWLSDRDRFSYQGLNSPDRLTQPMIKEAGQWRGTDWETALQTVADGLRSVCADHGAEWIGGLVAPTATLEEMYLLGRLFDSLGCPNLDHRLRQLDFSDQDVAPVFPWLGQSIEALEQLDAVLVVGSNVSWEQPIAAHRLRKAALHGAQLMFINPLDFDFHFPVAAKMIMGPAGMVAALAGVAKALVARQKVTVPKQLQTLIEPVQIHSTHQAIAAALAEGQQTTVLLGSLAINQPYFSTLRALSSFIAEITGCQLGYLPEGANTAGAWMSGMLPHRELGGKEKTRPGLDAAVMLAEPLKAYVLLGIEPECDCADPAKAVETLRAANLVVSLTSFVNETMQEYADVLLPIAAFAETSGTFINAEGRWQSFTGAGRPPGEGRPAWKVLRVLGNLLGIERFDYLSSEEVRDELHEAVGEITGDNTLRGNGALILPVEGADLIRIGDVPIYAVDPLVRRAEALQRTTAAADGAIYISGAQAQALGLSEAGNAVAIQGKQRLSLPVIIDDKIPVGCARIPAGMQATAGLGSAFGALELTSNEGGIHSGS